MTGRLTLYHYPLCPFCRKVRLALFEKGMPYGLITEMPWSRRPEFLKMNPVGDLPVLIESDGRVLTNHHAIAEFLNEIKPLPNLLGETPRGRAEVRRLSNWMDTAFYADVVKPLLNERVIKALKTQETPNSTLIHAGRENLKSYLKYLDWLAGRRSYLGGRMLSLADLSAAAQLSVLDYLGEISWDAFPDAKTWYVKIKSRPSFNSLLQDKVAGIMPSSGYAELDF